MVQDTLSILHRRAQAMCDADHCTRWVKYTSLGWRIELDPPADEALPHVKVEPMKVTP